MSLLLDTQILIWQVFGSDRLNTTVRDRISGVDQRFFSVVSLWEVVIKAGLGRTDFNHDARAMRRALIDVGYAELPVNALHVFEVGNLQPLHGDPFDRLLIAQARVEGLTLLTADKVLARYGSPVERV